MEQIHTSLSRHLCLVLLFMCSVKQTQCAHIIGFAPLDLVSHHRVLWKLGKELQTRGHKYTHILPSFRKETYDDVDTKIFDSSLTNKEIRDWFLDYSRVGDWSKDVFALFQVLNKIAPQQDRLYRRFCEDFLKNESLIAELQASVDLVLCDLANACCFILADMLNVTRIDVSTYGFAGVYGAFLFSFPQPALYTTLQASILLPSTNRFSFLNRLKGFVTYGLFFWSASSYPILGDVWEENAKAKSKFKNAAIARKTHGIALITHDFALEQSHPLGANIKVIGAISTEPARKLPEYLDQYMTENKVVVLVSFGTIFSDYPIDLAQTIADELSQVSASVLWQYSGKLPKNLGKNIKIVPWIPSFNDILGYSSTKVFVTHGGLHSFQEGVYHGVPMVVIPMYGDQPRQGDLVQSKGIGVAMEWKSIKANGKALQNAINDVLGNEVYKENIKTLSTIMKDRKQSPTEEGADWIEYALRHDGAAHLTSEAIDLPEYKLNMFDVFIFILVVVFLIVYLILRLCCSTFQAYGRKKLVGKEKET